MCRFLVYSGEPILLHDILYGPAHSIVKQSYSAHDGEDRVNADGFGVGWYVPEISPMPAVFRSPQPAWTSGALRSISTLTRSGLIFAHVRAASEGLEVSEQNCHPFSAVSFLWMHNGTLGGHAELKDWARRFLSRTGFARIRGTTDSEYLFAFFLEQWEEARKPRDPGELAGVLRKSLQFIADILRDSNVREPSTLNLALTDGETVLATRHGIRLAKPPLSLYLARGVRVAGAAKGTVVASEPLFPDSAWEEVPPGTLLVIRPDGRAERTAI